MANELLVRVEVVFAPAPRLVRSVKLELPVASTVALAVQRSGLTAELTLQERSGLKIGVWGRSVAPDQVVRDQDRLELYRPLKVDPKVARRERFSQQGAKTAGLFTKRRKGAKSGY